MPRRLIDRCRDDSIREFRLAARQRFDDALALAEADRRTGAIYLLGYTAEMTLKAAYFSLIGLTDTQTITWKGDIQAAIEKGRKLNIAWPAKGAGHNIRAWADLLIAQRSSALTQAYSLEFRREVQQRGQQFDPLWRETLRYHKNRAYFHEVVQARETAEWLLVHSHLL